MDELNFNDVTVQIFLTNISYLSKVSPIINKYFAKGKTVSTLVKVSSLVKKFAK